MAMPDCLFPPLEPHDAGMLPVGDSHTLYWEMSGRPDGEPILYLHGGPGGAGGPDLRRFYDPAHYRIILFHQRGAGRSVPAGEIAGNTTWHLVADIERLRRRLGIGRWIVAGGSWGSTLALAYAQAHPEPCRALLLNGIFLGRRRDIDWFLTGARDFFPREWDALTGFLPVAERGDILAGYRRRILDGDADAALPAVRAWATYEGSIAALAPDPGVLDMFQDPAFALSYSRMNMHYFAHGCFLDENPILARMDRIAHVPSILVHGRYDLATPYRAAVDLAARWPAARLVTVEGAGHSRYEAALATALIAAAEDLKQLAPDPR